VAAGALAAAERTLLEALRPAPEDPDLLLRLGRVRAIDGRPAAAIGPLRAAAARARPGDPDALLALASAHRAARAPAAAAAALDEAARVAPADPRPPSLLAALHRERGDAVAATEMIDRAIALSPDDHAAQLIRAGLLNDAGRHVEALERLDAVAARPPASPSLRGELHAERARALEKLDRSPEAWAAFTAANQAQAADPAMQSVDPGRAAAWIEAYRRHLPSGTGAVCEVPEGQAAPFDLLVGFSRSGTTMLEQMLAAHPDVRTSGERPIVQRLKRTLGPVADDPDAFARRIAGMSATELTDLRRRVITIAREEVTGPEPRLVHKHPMDSMELPLLERIVPDARVLYAVRDPRDVCVSCFKQRFVPNMVNVHFLATAGTVRLQEQVAGAWFDRRDQLRCRWTEIRYEDVADDFETGARRVLDFLGLPWDDAVRSFHRAAADRWISTPSAAAVREAPHRRAVGGWRRHAESLSDVRERLDALALRWGYDAS
jgi:hypothetical protein